MGYFDSIYAADLPHRAVTVYMYLKDRTNVEMRVHRNEKAVPHRGRGAPRLAHITSHLQHGAGRTPAASAEALLSSQS